MLHYTQLEWLARDKHSSLFGPFISYEENEVLHYSRNLIHNTLFSSYNMNGFNELECYKKIGWKGLPGTNTLTFQVHWKV